MANATKLPDLFFAQWARPNAGFPKLAAGLSASPTDLELSFTEPLLDENGDAPAKAVLIGITTANGYTEHFYIAAGDFDASGLTATATARGIRLSGLDFTTGDNDLMVTHNADEKVFVAVEGVYEAILNAVMRGDTISTGGNDFIIGMGTDGVITIKRDTDGTDKGWLRWNNTLSKVQYSNDGSLWTSIDDAVVGYLVKASVADTTPGYLQSKLVAGGSVALTLLNPGANEQIEIRVDATNVDINYTFAETAPIGGPVSTVSADTVENTVYNTFSVGGTEATFDTGTVSNVVSVNLQDNLWVEAYAVSSQAYAIAGSADRNNTQTYGAAAGAGANTGGSISICKIDSTRFLLTYRKSSDNTVYSRIGSVDTTTKVITYGSEVSVGTQSSAAQGYTACSIVDTDKVIVCFRDTGTSNRGRARVATCSGTTLSTFGTVNTFETGATSNMAVSQSSAGYAVVHFRDEGDSNKGKGVLLSVSGTTISPAAAVEIDANASSSFSSKYITDGQILVTWIGGASTYVQARVANVSGLVLDYPVAAIAVNALAALTPSCTVIDTGTAFVAYEESASSDGKFNQIEITTLTTLTAGTQYSFNSTNNVSSVAVSKVDGRDKFVVAFVDEADSSKGNAIIFQNYDNRSKCVGLAVAATAAGASGSVRSKGFLTGLSGLTAAAVTYMGIGSTYTTTQSTTFLQLGVAKDTAEIDINIFYFTTAAVANVFDAKGDILVGTADNAFAALSAGTKYKSLTTDSTTTSGLKWDWRPITLFAGNCSNVSGNGSQNVVSFTIPGGLVESGDCIRATFVLHSCDSGSSSENWVFTAAFGGSAGLSCTAGISGTAETNKFIFCISLSSATNAKASIETGGEGGTWLLRGSNPAITVDFSIDSTFTFNVDPSDLATNPSATGGFALVELLKKYTA